MKTVAAFLSAGFIEVRRSTVRLARAQMGGVAVSVALTILPALALIGGTIDYIRLQENRQKLAAAADAAVLGATAKTSWSLTAAGAQALAGSIFSNALPHQILSTVTASTPAVADSGSTRTATFAYSARFVTSFLGLVGLPTIPISGTATATATTPIYMDFYLLLDNTPSMGIGATSADISKMVSSTGCAFACHITSQSPNDAYGTAKSIGVTMRIDVVRTATQKLMDTAATTQAVANQFRMAIYTFGQAAETKMLTAITPLTANLANAKALASAVDLMTVPYQNYNNDMDTDFDGILTSMNALIPTPGSGASASVTPQKVLFLVSDGVADAHYPSTCSQPNLNGGRCEEPINTAKCTAIKNRGIKIAVLYTTYLPLTDDEWYNESVAPFASKIATNMQACASPGLYFEVSPSQGIADAMKVLFQKAVQTARLSS